MKKVVALAVLVASSSAHAEVPIGVAVGPSIAAGFIEKSDGGPSAVLALRADVGFRAVPQLMLGVHVGAATGSLQDRDYLTGGTTYRPQDAGLSAYARLTSVNLGAWIGFERSYAKGYDRWYRVPGTSPAFGLSVGIDVAHSGAHHLAITASIDAALKGERDFSYRAIGIGATYEFWAP
jgi:hypothetical protein